MKTAKELYNGNKTKIRQVEHNEYMTQGQFNVALTEHDKETVKMIDEMIKDKDGKYYLMSVIEILTELKNKLEMK